MGEGQRVAPTCIQTSSTLILRFFNLKMTESEFRASNVLRVCHGNFQSSSWYRWSHRKSCCLKTDDFAEPLRGSGGGWFKRKQFKLLHQTVSERPGKWKAEKGRNKNKKKKKEARREEEKKRRQLEIQQIEEARQQLSVRQQGCRWKKNRKEGVHCVLKETRGRVWQKSPLTRNDCRAERMLNPQKGKQVLGGQGGRRTVMNGCEGAARCPLGSD